MDSHPNYEELDDMEDPDQYQSDSQAPPPPDFSAPPEHQLNTTEKVVEQRLCRLPLNRIKGIMKLDPEINMISSDSVFVITKVTEMFIQSLARESFVFVQQGKKKTVQKKDVESAMNAVDALMFLEGALDFN